MKKSYKLYIIIWAAFFAAFNIAVLINPAKISKETAGYWIGYVFIMLGFFCQLIYNVKLLKKKEEFCNALIIFINHLMLAAVVIAGGICMVFPSISTYLSVIICVLTFAFSTAIIASADFAANVIFNGNKNIKTKTYTINQLTAKALNLISLAKTDEIKAYTKKVYETLRYSDPVSNISLAETDESIQRQFAAFEDSVIADDKELAAEISAELTAMIKERNITCRMLKQ